MVTTPNPQNTTNQAPGEPKIVLNDGTSVVHLARLVREIHNLPVFPHAGVKLLEAFRNPYYNVKQLGDIIASDVGMATRVLRIANSSYYGIKNRITSVNHAVMMLGAEEVEHLAMTLCFLQISPLRSSTDLQFNPQAYIEHSMLVGRIGQHLASVAGFQLVGRGEAYAAGLLHDVGLFVIYRYHRQAMRDVLNFSAKWRVSYNRAELETLHVSHAALGAWLSQRWNLPPALCEAIAYHHSRVPKTATLPELVALLRLAKQIANRLEVHNSVDAELEELDERSLRLFAAKGFPDNTTALVDSLIAEHQETFEEMVTNLRRLLRGPAMNPRATRSVGDLDQQAQEEEQLDRHRKELLARRRRKKRTRLGRFLHWLGLTS